MDFGYALDMLKAGKMVTRLGWNGKGMWLALATVSHDGMKPEGLIEMTVPYIYMRTADAQLVPWLASQTDLLARDWMLVNWS